MDTKLKLILTGVAFALISVIIVGLSWLALAGEGVSLNLKAEDAHGVLEQEEIHQEGGAQR